MLHVHRLRGIGGSERHLLTLLPALREHGVDARFLGFDDGDPDPFYEQLRQAKVPYERLRAPRDLDPRLALATHRAVRRVRPDIVHTHLVHADVYGTLGALASRTALVSTKHNDDPFRRGAFRHVERLFMRRADRIICITDALARFNVERVGLPAEKLEVVHYGLDDLPAAWGPPGRAVARRPGRGCCSPSRASSHRKGSTSRSRRSPGFDLAIRRPCSSYSGEGSLRSELLALAAARGLADAVFLAGNVGDVADWLGRAELLVHPARWEGFGLALLEAMLAELPVVASDVSAIPEIVVDGGTGRLVPSDDPGQLAAALDELLSDPQLARSYGEAGRKRALVSFSVARMTACTRSRSTNAR